MKTLKIALISLCLVTGLMAQKHPLQELIDAARTDSPKLKELFDARDEYGKRIPELAGRDGVAVWGQEFVFAVESENPASVMINQEAPVEMKRVPGTNYWYLWKMMRLGTTHRYQYMVDGRNYRQPYEVAAYNPDAYPLPGVPRGTLSERKTITSTIYPEMSTNYWVYTNPGVDTVRGAPLMVWQDGETIVGNQDLVRLRLQIVSDNLVAKGLIPPMVHVLIQPGSGGTEGRNMRSILYDTVSDRYGKYLQEEILAEVEKTYKIRSDAYSRAVAGASSGAICAFNVGWYYPDNFSRVLSHIGSYTALQWRPEQGLDGGYIVPVKVRREGKKNLRVWLSAGSEDQEHVSGSWPLNNIQLANSLKMKGYDFHFRWGTNMHSIAQGALDLPEALAWLWRDYDPAKTEQTYEMEEAEKAKPVYRVDIINRDAW